MRTSGVTLRREAIEGQRCFADVEAVRADLDIPVATDTALKETWDRYHLPVAVTEAHLCGTREEQLRWLHEVWEGARKLREQGADVRAVTAWSLFGAFDWNILVTREQGFYEPGVFDVRSGKPRPTALARLVHDLATKGEAGEEPLLHLPGWWQREDRLFQPRPHGRSFDTQPSKPVSDMEITPTPRSPRPLIILGANGTLGSAFVKLCDAREIPHHVLTRKQLDVTRPFVLDDLLEETRAWAVVNAAGFVDVDAAEEQSELCERINTVAAIAIAEACGKRGLPVVAFSSDLVFDGATSSPYTESRTPNPVNVYGRSKAQMERGVLDVAAKGLIVRTSAFFGPSDRANFVTRTLTELEQGGVVRAASDQLVSPTYVPDLVHNTLDLLVDGETGIWHLANAGAVTWSELARVAAEMAKSRADAIEACATHELGLRARRPRYAALRSERAKLMPPLEDALARYLVSRNDPDWFRKAA